MSGYCNWCPDVPHCTMYYYNHLSSTNTSIPWQIHTFPSVCDYNNSEVYRYRFESRSTFFCEMFRFSKALLDLITLTNHKASTVKTCVIERDYQTNRSLFDCHYGTKTHLNSLPNSFGCEGAKLHLFTISLFNRFTVEYFSEYNYTK